jgi:hypothetical protein
MAATPSIEHPETEHSPDKEQGLHNISNAASHIQTPPASDGSSHGHKDDDAASSSSLSDLEDDIESDTRFEDQIAGAGADVQDDGRLDIKADRYEGGIPIFTPVRCSFPLELGTFYTINRLPFCVSWISSHTEC